MDGKMAVISGFSGAGKGTLVKKLLEKYPDEYVLSISKTTRSPRKEEKEGIHYFFVSAEEFEKEIAADSFVEYAEFNGNYYGTPKNWVTKRVLEGRNVILEIEVQGALQVKDKFPDALLIFVGPPTVKELINRLIARASETAEDIRNRLEIALVREYRLMDKYDYIVINDDLDTCAKEIHDIIAGKRNKSDMTAYMDRISGEIKNILESGEI